MKDDSAYSTPRRAARGNRVDVMVDGQPTIR